MQPTTNKSLFSALNAFYVGGLFILFWDFALGYSPDNAGGWAGDILGLGPIILTTLFLIGQRVVAGKEQKLTASGKGSGAKASRQWVLALFIYIIITMFAISISGSWGLK